MFLFALSLSFLFYFNLVFGWNNNRWPCVVLCMLHWYINIKQFFFKCCLPARHITPNTHCCCYITFKRIHVLKLDGVCNIIAKVKNGNSLLLVVNFENKYLDMNECYTLMKHLSNWLLVSRIKRWIVIIKSWIKI